MFPTDENNGSPLPQSLAPAADKAQLYPIANHEPVLGLPGPVLGSPALSEPSGATFFHALRRRWLSALGLGLIGAALAVAVTCMLVPPKYKAQALVHIAARAPKGIFLNQGDYMSTDEFTAFMRTQSAVVKSKPVLQAALREPQVADLGEVRNQADPLAWLEKNLEVDTGLGAEILRLTLSGDEPDEVAALLNAIVKAYLQQASNAEQSSHLARIELLQENFRQYQEGLRRKRGTLKELEDQLQVDDGDTLKLRYPSALQQLATLEGQLLQSRLELKRATTELAGLQEQEKKPVAVTVTEAALDEYLRQDPLQLRLITHLAALDDEIEQIKTRAKEPRRSVALKAPLENRASVQTAIDGRRKEVRPQVQALLERKAVDERAASIAKLKTEKVLLEDKVKTIDVEVQKQDAVVKRIGSAIRSPEKPTSDLEALRNEVAQMDATQKRVADQVEIMRVEPRPPSRASLLEQAEPPRTKNFQVQIKLAGAAGVAAFALIGFLVSWREYGSRKIYAATDVIEGLGMHLIGTLPALPANARALLPETTNGRSLRLQSVFSESVDALRAQLLHAAEREGVRVVMITSAQAGEGKTTLAGQLAASLARAWRKTLLIDGDLRHPGLHRQFDLPLEPGFSEVLRGEAECDDVVRPTPVSRLWMIAAGQCDAHATQALAQREVRILLDRLKDQYDFIVVDSSPVLPVADALSLGQHVDGVVFSILRDVSRMPAVQASHQRLASLGIRVLGTVVSGATGEASNAGYPYPARSRQ